MKATDLMIGDWVIEKDRVCRVSFNTTIKEVRKEDCATSASSSTRYYDIEPIPLTPEILEKNGYRNSVLVDDYFIAHGVHYNVDSKRIMFGYEYGSVLEVECKYVHELQHALRLCGIEKEIVL